MPTAAFLFRLKAGASREDHERWVVEEDYRLVAELKSIRSQKIYRILGNLEGGGEAPYDYLELIEFTSAPEYFHQLQTHPNAKTIGGHCEKFLDMSQAAGAWGELVPQEVARPDLRPDTVVFLTAKFADGVSPEQYVKWVVEVDYPLVRAVRNVVWMDVFRMGRAVLRDGPPPFDHLSAAHVTDADLFRRELADSLATATINRDFPTYLRTPALSHTVGVLLPPSRDPSARTDPVFEVLEEIATAVRRIGQAIG